MFDENKWHWMNVHRFFACLWTDTNLCLVREQCPLKIILTSRVRSHLLESSVPSQNTARNQPRSLQRNLGGAILSQVLQHKLYHALSWHNLYFRTEWHCFLLYLSLVQRRRVTTNKNKSELNSLLLHTEPTPLLQLWYRCSMKRRSRHLNTGNPLKLVKRAFEKRGILCGFCMIFRKSKNSLFSMTLKSAFCFNLLLNFF